jgi:hypothetical protein
MTSLTLNEKVFTSRAASTANLLISSLDRNLELWNTPYKFQVSSQNSLMNGFFSRIAVAEVTLSWAEPNIKTGYNDTFKVEDLSSNVYTATLPQGFYTFKQAIDQVVILLNGLNTGATWSVSGIGPTFSLNCTSNQTIVSTPLVLQMGFFSDAADTNHYIDGSPVLLRDMYIDFVCTNLTNQQKLKDASTAASSNIGILYGNEYVRDVLCRWYLAESDSQPQIDAYGFPILLGYTGFYLRRGFAYPKQIRWESSVPVGNLLFEVFDDQGAQLSTQISGSTFNTNWFMTLLVSED